MFFCFFFFSCSCDLLDLHSFPTRRSSDLLGLDRLEFWFECTHSILTNNTFLTQWKENESNNNSEENYRKSHILECHVLGKDRKSTRLNSSHVSISYAVFCLKKKIQRESYN